MQPPIEGASSYRRREPGNAALPGDEEKQMAGAGELAELRGEIVGV